MQDHRRALRSTDRGRQYRPAVVRLALHLHVAGLQPSVDEGRGRLHPLQSRRVVGDQALGESALIHVAAMISQAATPRSRARCPLPATRSATGTRSSTAWARWALPGAAHHARDAPLGEQAHVGAVGHADRRAAPGERAEHERGERVVRSVSAGREPPPVKAAPRAGRPARRAARPAASSRSSPTRTPRRPANSTRSGTELAHSPPGHAAHADRVGQLQRGHQLVPDRRVHAPLVGGRAPRARPRSGRSPTRPPGAWRRGRPARSPRPRRSATRPARTPRRSRWARGSGRRRSGRRPPGRRRCRARRPPRRPPP